MHIHQLLTKLLCNTFHSNIILSITPTHCMWDGLCGDSSRVSFWNLCQPHTHANRMCVWRHWWQDIVVISDFCFETHKIVWGRIMQSCPLLKFCGLDQWQYSNIAVFKWYLAQVTKNRNQIKYLPQRVSILLSIQIGRYPYKRMNVVLEINKMTPMAVK